MAIGTKREGNHLGRSDSIQGSFRLIVFRWRAADGIIAMPTTPTESARRRVNAAAHALLSAIADLDVSEPFAVALSDHYHQVYVAVTPIMAQFPRGIPIVDPTANGQAAADQMPPLALDILAAADSVPRTAKQLAARCRRPLNTYFRSVLRSLWDSGQIAKTSKGYRRGSD